MPIQRQPNLIVGREREQQQLRELLDQTIAGQGALALVSGEAGIGKTTLVNDLIVHAQDLDALVLTGHCYDLTITPPYGPWAEILRRYPDELELPDLPEQFREGTRMEGIHSQGGLFDLVEQFLADITAVRPLVLLLEDLHWSDRASLDLLRHIGRMAVDYRLLILATYRDDELTRRDPFFQMIPVLVRESGAVRVELQGLDAGDLTTLIAGRYGLADDSAARLADYLGRRAEGNPLFVEELLHTLEIEDILSQSVSGWQLGELADVPVPPFVVQVIEGRLAGLERADRRQLEIAAVIGQDVSFDLWTQVGELTDDDLLATVRQATQANIVDETLDGSGVHFRHALIREALYSGVSALQRRDWHRTVANRLLEAPHPDPDDIVTHLERADDPRLVEWLIRSGDRAMVRFAWDTAVERYERASAILELQGAPDPAQMCDILLKLGNAQSSAGSGRGLAVGAGNDPEVEATFWRAAEWARKAESPERLGEAALGVVGINFGAAHGGIEGVLLMKEALDALPEEDSQLRVRLLSRWATGGVGYTILRRLTPEVSLEQAYEYCDEAIAMARRLDDPATLAYAFCARFNVGHGPEDLSERLEIADEIIRLGDIADDPHIVTAGLWRKHQIVAELGELETARLTMDRLATIIEPLRMPLYDWYLATWQVGERISLGAFDEAKQELNRLNTVWPDSGSGNSQKFKLAREEDRLPEIAEHVQRGIDGYYRNGFPLALGYMILWYLETEQYAEARQAVDRMFELHFDQALTMNGFGLRMLGYLAEGCTFFQDVERLRLVYDKLLPFEDHNIYGTYSNYYGDAVSHHLGILATTMEEWEAAEAHFVRAIELEDGWGVRPATAYSRYEWAKMLCRRNQPGDLHQSANLLRDALATADELGMVRLRRLATELSREINLAGTAYPAGLTKREVEVLREAADDLTDIQIGERLFISPRTVGQHLRNIYNKIGVNSRTAAVRWAVEQGLV